MKRRLLWTGLLLAVLVLSLLIPGIRWAVCGWVRGDAFYCGVPSFVWAARLQACRKNLFNGIYGVMDEPPTPWCVQRAEELLHVRMHGGLDPRVLSEEPKAVPVLLDLLRHKDGKVRAAAAWYLGRLGPKANDAIPHLIPLLKDTDPEVKDRAQYALSMMGKSAESALPDLLEALNNSEDRSFQHKVLGSFEGLAEESDAAVLALATVLKHEDAFLRLHAVEVLGRLGPRAAAAIPALISVREDSDEQVRIAVAMVLRESDSAAPADGTGP
jgi:HEAT repeat protein